MRTIEVRSQVFGGLQDSPLLPSVFLNLIQEHLTVAQLIQHTVEQQVRELLVRREMDTQQVRHTLERHYLTAAEVAVQAQQGAVCYPSDRTIKTPEVDLKDEIQKALRAFEAGSYIILVNRPPA
jgi:hypothetical protein